MGPLQGVTIIELAGIGPVPLCGMMLADMGAQVIRVDRAVGGSGGIQVKRPYDILGRGRKSIRVNLKDPDGVEVIYRLLEKADALIEGFRPGVTERMGLGPDDVLERCPHIVYGRMTGWGQDGPLASIAGHDINYIALTGALDAIGPKGGKPTPPLNLVGDFGGGGMLLFGGVLCGIIEAMKSGKGQVIDAAMVDGAGSLMAGIYGFRAQGLWEDARGSNFADGGAPFYDTYECADGNYISQGSIEPQFYAELMQLGGFDGEDPLFKEQFNKANWPECKRIMAERFLTKTRDEWCEIMQQSDVCFAPVLSMAEAPDHPHNVHRKAFVEIDGWQQPAPAPRFSRTVQEVQGPPPALGADTRDVLAQTGYSPAEIDTLLSRNTVAGALE
ncbi:MAG TPA: carnitine dehydratase [Porticoccaceae bacterium]|nr:carnitine dehydratase [Porticoccaceae bacterium]